MKNQALSVDKKQMTPSHVSRNKNEDEKSEIGVPATSSVGIYAIAEMSQRAEEGTLKVRSELFRIGCRPPDLSVLRQGGYLQMKCRQQIILVSPQEVLGVLRKIPRGTALSEVWERVFQHAHKFKKQKRLTYVSLAAISISLLTLAAFLVTLRVF